MNPRLPISPLFPYTTLFRSPTSSSIFFSSVAASSGAGSAGVTAAGAEGGPDCASAGCARSEEQTSELQSRLHLVCRLLPEKKNREPAARGYLSSDTFRHLFR